MHSVPTVQSWLSGSSTTINIDTNVTDEFINRVLKTLQVAVKKNFEEVQQHMDFFGKHIENALSK